MNVVRHMRGGQPGPRAVADPNATGGAGAKPDLSDRLEYIADLALELKHMAETSGCTTLIALLELASAEARQQRALRGS